MESASSSLTSLLTEADPIRFVLGVNDNEEHVAIIKTLPVRTNQVLSEFPPCSTNILTKCLQMVQYKEKPQQVHPGLLGIPIYSTDFDGPEEGEEGDEGDEGDYEEDFAMTEEDEIIPVYSEGAGDPATSSP